MIWWKVLLDKLEVLLDTLEVRLDNQEVINDVVEGTIRHLGTTGRETHRPILKPGSFTMRYRCEGMVFDFSR